MLNTKKIRMTCLKQKTKTGNPDFNKIDYATAEKTVI